jgi:hypothetical protein
MGEWREKKALSTVFSRKFGKDRIDRVFLCARSLSCSAKPWQLSVERELWGVVEEFKVF